MHLGTALQYDKDGNLIYENEIINEDGEKFKQLYIVKEGAPYDESGEPLNWADFKLSEAVASLKDSGYITAHIGVVDSGGTEKEAFYLNLNLIDTLSIKKGSEITFVGGHSSTSYVSINDWKETLVVSVNVEVHLNLSATELVYEPDKLNDTLPGMLVDLLKLKEEDGGFIYQLLSSIALRLNNNFYYDRGLNLGLAVVGNIDINNIFASDLTIVLFDTNILDSLGYYAKDGNTYKVIAGIYIQDNKAYVDMSYFGISTITISDLEGTYTGAISLFWDLMYNDTASNYIDEADYYNSKRNLMDSVMKQQTLSYFFDNFYKDYSRSYPITN
ncbi:MAG: hypothetical protein EOM87_10505, partial [Clostridia bacterium]|nr:hypothetical protein [Clostridia bacterium]